MEEHTLNKKYLSKKNARARSKKLALGITVALSLLLVVGIVAQQFIATTEVHALESHEGLLALPVEAINEQASFFSYELDGTYMEFFAVKDAHGHILTGMNTCYSCYNSGKGYFTQQGNDFVCNNCGNHYPLDSHNNEYATTECAPLPITEDMLQQEGDQLYIKTESLSRYTHLFNQWQR